MYISNNYVSLLLITGDLKPSALTTLSGLSSENVHDSAIKLLALTVSCVRAIPSYQQVRYNYLPPKFA